MISIRLLLTVFLSLLPVWAASAGPSSKVAPVVEKVKPALVTIQGNKATDAGKDKGEVLQPGLGIIVDSKGIIVTNHHVIQGAETIEVVLKDGRKRAAKVVFSDVPSDLAVLKVNPPELLPQVAFGDSEKLALGDQVLALGPPFGDSFSVTVGLISGKIRTAEKGNEWLRIDTALGPGLSGGLLIDLEGRLLGLVVRKAAGKRVVDRAIPVNRLKELVVQSVGKR